MRTEDLNDTTFQCVHFLPSNELPSNKELVESGFKISEIDGSKADSQKQLWNAIAEAFSFPPEQDLSWELLNQGLTDLSWIPAHAYLLIIRHSRPIWSKTPDCAGKLVECWLSSAEMWAGEDIPFHLIFVLED